MYRSIENRLVLVHLDCVPEVMPEHFLAGDNLHGTSAQHEAGAYQHRISDALRRADAAFNVSHRLTLRVRDAQRFDDRVKGVAVLRLLDALAVGADDPHAAARQRLRQIDGGLPAQRGDDAIRMLKMDDVHHVLRRQRLKVQLVRRCVVGRNGFGVVVDDDCLVAHFPDGMHRVDGGVVELHALPDADGSRAEDNHLAPVGHDRLVLLGVGGVEVGAHSCRIRLRRCRSSCIPGKCSPGRATRTPRPRSCSTARRYRSPRSPCA